MRFDLAGANDRELPLILGLMPVLAKHADQSRHVRGDLDGAARSAAGRTASATSIRARASRSTRNPDYWGRDLAVNRGFWNFDEVRFDYYRDASAYHEAFKKGLFDVRKEDDPGRWQTGYDFPALREGRVIKETFTSGLPKPSFNFVFNTRRALFADIRVREAVALLFDFEWVNRSIFFDLYRRSASFFEGSELSARGRAGRCARARPARAISRTRCAPDVLDGTWQPPVTDGSGRDRAVLRRALAPAQRGRLRAARHRADREGRAASPSRFEILAAEPRRGAPRPPVRQPAQARRDHGAGAACRCGTI